MADHNHDDAPGPEIAMVEISFISEAACRATAWKVTKIVSGPLPRQQGALCQRQEPANLSNRSQWIAKNEAEAVLLIVEKTIFYL